VSRAEELADQLRAIVEALDEWALDELQQAVADGRTSRPRSDKLLTQARRAVEKAEHLLRGLDEAGV
jgi:exonuclease VII small subunit